MDDKKGNGLFMVWADVPGDVEEDLNRWYEEEHLAELLAIPGVLSGALYKAVRGSPKYLAAYELSNPEVRDSPEYQEHLINPTERSQRVTIQRTRVIGNNYRQIFPREVSREVAQSDMAPVLMIGRMSIPEDQENEWNNFYNTVYAPKFENVPGCLRFRRYALYTGHGPKYSVVYEFEHEKVAETNEWLAARAKSGGTVGDLYPRMTHDEGSVGIYKKIFQPVAG